MNKLANLFMLLGHLFIHASLSAWAIAYSSGIIALLYVTDVIPLGGMLAVELIDGWFPVIIAVVSKNVATHICEVLLIALSVVAYLGLFATLGLLFYDAAEKVKNRDFSFIEGWLLFALVVGGVIHLWSEDFLTKA